MLLHPLIAGREKIKTYNKKTTKDRDEKEFEKTLIEAATAPVRRSRTIGMHDHRMTASPQEKTVPSPINNGGAAFVRKFSILDKKKEYEYLTDDGGDSHIGSIAGNKNHGKSINDIMSQIGARSAGSGENLKTNML